MTKSILVSDDLYERLEALARPFIDKEPADVIRWLLQEVDHPKSDKGPAAATLPSPAFKPETTVIRVPRLRGATVDLDGTAIRADTVPDLCQKVLDYLFSHGHGTKLLSMSPYKTSSERYFYSKTPKHPKGNDFFKAISCHGLKVEVHKSYQSAVKQLGTLAARCGVKLTYLG